MLLITTTNTDIKNQHMNLNNGDKNEQYCNAYWVLP